MRTMKWIASLVCLASSFALVVGCEGDDSSSGGFGYGYSSCSYYTTCGACTPVSGCGWCQAADGTGTCASGPDQCTGSAFNWTWNSTGCQSSVGADDAGYVGLDAGYRSSDAAVLDATWVNDATPAEAGNGTTGDATPGDAWSDAGTDASDATAAADAVSDAATSGCTNASSLACTSSAPYGVVCTTADPFDSALAEPPTGNGCSLLLVPTAVGTADFCCALPLSAITGIR